MQILFTSTGLIFTSYNPIHNLRQVFAFLNCNVSSRVFLPELGQGNLSTRLTRPVPTICMHYTGDQRVANLRFIAGRVTVLLP